MIAATAARCVACSGKLSFFGRRLAYSYHRCRDCGTLQLVPLPDGRELAEAYARMYAASAHIDVDPETSRHTTRPYHEAILRTLLDYRVAGAVAELGGGWGGLGELLIANGFSYRGADPSEEMARHCRHRGLPVIQGDIAALSGESYCALVLANVFEHLVDHDNWLTQANHLLCEGGLFVSLQPTAHFAYLAGQLVRGGISKLPLPAIHQEFCPPWHAVFFSMDGMRALTERHGFALLDIRPAPQGRARGITGLAQYTLECVNRLGGHVLGLRWPLVVGHLFVFRKVHEAP